MALPTREENLAYFKALEEGRSTAPTGAAPTTPITERLASGFRFEGAKRNYLISKHGKENVRGTGDDIEVKRDGRWVKFNPKGLDWGDIVSAIPSTVAGIGAGAGAAALAPAAVLGSPLLAAVAMSGAAGAAGDLAMQAISPIAGVFTGGAEDSTIPERLVSTGLSAGIGAAFPAGAQALLSGGKFAKNIGSEGLRAVVNKTAKLTGVPREGLDDIVQAAKNEGIHTTLANQTNSRLASSIEDYLGTSFFSSKKVLETQKKQGQQFSEYVKRSLPAGKTAKEAGQKVYGVLDDEIGNERAALRQLSSDIEKNFASTPEAKAPVIPIGKYASQERKILKSRKAVLATQPERLQKEGETIAKRIGTAVETGKVSAVDLWGRLRDIDEALNFNPMTSQNETARALVSTHSSAELNALKTSLIDDLELAVNRQSKLKNGLDYRTKEGKGIRLAGQSAEDLLNVREGYKAASQRKNELVNHLINTETSGGNSPEALVKMVFRKGIDATDSPADVSTVIDFLAATKSPEAEDSFIRASFEHLINKTTNLAATSQDAMIGDVPKEVLNAISPAKIASEIASMSKVFSALTKNRPELSKALTDIKAVGSVIGKSNGLGMSPTRQRIAAEKGFELAVSTALKPVSLAWDAIKGAGNIVLARSMAEIMMNPRSAKGLGQIMKESLKTNGNINAWLKTKAGSAAVQSLAPILTEQMKKLEAPRE